MKRWLYIVTGTFDDGPQNYSWSQILNLMLSLNHIQIMTVVMIGCSFSMFFCEKDSVNAVKMTITL